jgi:hypothetical protein
LGHYHRCCPLALLSARTLVTSPARLRTGIPAELAKLMRHRPI